MGGGTWSRNTYDTSTKSKIDSGTTFAYSRVSKSRGVYEAHDNLKVIVDGKPVTRESRDSEEHTETVPIVIGFDETGSMGENPEILQRSLKALFGMLVRRDVVSDPQVAMAAYGDTECDEVPIQLSQFESDNRIDDNLDNIFLEGRGGGNGGETSTALAWFVAHHVETDAWDKRNKRGYLFLIGDECPITVTEKNAKRFLGEVQPFDITPEMAFDAASERWDTYFLLVNNSTAHWQRSREKYERLLGEDHVIILETTESAPAVIASIIGLCEETVTSDVLAGDLAAAGFSDEVALSASRSTSKLSKKGEGYADLSL